MNKNYVIEKVYNQYFDLFINIGLRIYNLDLYTTEDMIHDSFAEALKDKQKIRVGTEAGVRNYTIMVFRNNCSRHIRKERVKIKSLGRYVRNLTGGN